MFYKAKIRFQIIATAIFVWNFNSAIAQQEDLCRRIKVVPVTCSHGTQTDHTWRLDTIEIMGKYSSSWRLYNLTDTAIVVSRMFWAEPNFQPEYSHSLPSVPPGDSLDFTYSHLPLSTPIGPFHKGAAIRIGLYPGDQSLCTFMLYFTGVWVSKPQHSDGMIQKTSPAPAHRGH